MGIQVPNLEKLSTSERIQLVQDLWDSIAADPDSVPLTEKQEEELDRRRSAYAEDRDPGSPWAEVRERIRDNE